MSTPLAISWMLPLSRWMRRSLPSVPISAADWLSALIAAAIVPSVPATGRAIDSVKSLT
jgi:hypothetical protein